MKPTEFYKNICIIDQYCVFKRFTKAFWYRENNLKTANTNLDVVSQTRKEFNSLSKGILSKEKF